MKKCAAWNAERMNLLSISLLLVCGTIDSLGKLWVNFLCLNFGSLENLSSLTVAALIFVLSLPLFIDTSFLLLQRVHPKELSSIIAKEMSSLETQYDALLLCPIEWHVWSLDKSCRVGTFKASLRSPDIGNE